jgi:hypothetical protein
MIIDVASFRLFRKADCWPPERVILVVASMSETGPLVKRRCQVLTIAVAVACVDRHLCPCWILSRQAELVIQVR